MDSNLRQENLHEVTTSDFESGSVVFGKFRIVELIGAGGMGRVYKVIQVDLKKEMALKVLQDRVNADTAVQRFQNEARAVSRLSHPNVASVYDFGVSEAGQLYMSMELVDGNTLDRLISLEGKIELEKFLTIFPQVCDALEHAHAKGIIHRDVKPGNIMIVDPEDGSPLKVKVLDFGIAKSTDNREGALTQPGDVLGSPLYMCPDMIKGIPATNKSDLYSLGCVMFKCLTGRTPFRGETILQTIVLHQTAPIPSPRLEMPESKVTDELSDLVLQLLAKNPEERPESAGSICASLSQMREVLRTERSIVPGAEHPAEEFTKQTARKSKWIGLVALLFLVVGGVVSLYVSKLQFANLPTVPTDVNPGAKFVGKKIQKAYKQDVPLRVQRIVRDSNVGAYLADCDASDEDIAELENATSLVKLDLTGNKGLTDKGVIHIRNLKLTHLGLEGTSVTTLVGVKAMTRMQDMGLAETNINDESLSNLHAMKQLDILSLAATAVTIEGVRKLVKNCTGLRRLDLMDCKNISANDLKQLRKEFPTCNFVVEKM